jgi:hypothetical protein
MGRGIVVKQSKNLLPPARNCGLTRQIRSKNLPITSAQKALLTLPFRHKFFMNHILFVKKCDQQGFELGLLQIKLFGL